MYTSIVYVEEGSEPFILSGLILRVRGNSGNRIDPVSLDLHQHNDEREQAWENARAWTGIYCNC